MEELAKICKENQNFLCFVDLYDNTNKYHLNNSFIND
jgi:hypothetical protein